MVNSFLYSGAHVDLNMKLYSRNTNSVASYINAYYSGVYVKFTPTADTYTKIEIYIKEATGAMAAAGNSSDCDDFFANSDRVEMTGVTLNNSINLGGVVYTANANMANSVQTLYIPHSVINAAATVDFTENSYLYVALRLNESDSHWVCGENAGTDEGDGSNASAIDNSYTRFKIDQTAPTMNSMLEHTTNDAYGSSIYIKTPSTSTGSPRTHTIRKSV